MATYEKKPLTPAPKEQLGIADTAVDRELSNLEEEETFACMDIASTQDPLRKLFGPSNPSPVNPSPVLAGLPSPSVHAYEKGVADVSVDSASYPQAPPPTPQADSERVAKGGHPALRSNAEKVIAAAALRASQDARRVAEKVKLIDYTLTAIQMRMENDRMLSTMLPTLSRDVAEKALTRFFKSRSEDYRGTLAGHSSVEDALASEVRQLHDAVNLDRIHGAPSNPGCGADLIQRMEDVESESSRERQRELGVVERELVEVDREGAKGANSMSESSLKLLSHTKERYSQLQRLHIENQRHKEQQLKEQQLKDQRFREQQLREQQQRAQKLEEQHVRDQQLHAQQMRAQRIGADDHLEQSFKAMNIREPQERDFQERELARRMSQGDHMLHALEGDQRAPRALHSVAGVATGEAGAGAYPVSRGPVLSSGHLADRSSNYATAGTPTGHSGSNSSGVLHPGAVMAQPSQRSSADRMSSSGLRQMVSNLPLHQQYPEVPTDRRALRMPSGPMASGEVPFLGVTKASRLPNAAEPPMPLAVRPAPQDYSYPVPYSHRAHVPGSHLAFGADQQHYSAQRSRSLSSGQVDPPHQRPPEYAIGRPHSLSNNSISQIPHGHFSPLLQQPLGAGYETAQEERLVLERRRVAYPYPAEDYLSQQSSDFSGYPLGTYYDEGNVAHAQRGYSGHVPLSAVSSQPSAGVTDPRFNPQSHPVAPLASNHTEEPHQLYRSNRGNGMDIAGPSRNPNYMPGLGQQPTSMYPVNRELQSWNRGGVNYIQSGPENRANGTPQGPVGQNARSALSSAGSQLAVSQSGYIPGHSPSNCPQGEESLSIYRQVEKGPNRYVEGTVKVQRRSNPQARTEFAKHDSSSYQEYLHIVQGRTEGTELTRNVHTGLVGDAQKYSDGSERLPSSVIRRARSDIPTGAVHSEPKQYGPQVPELSPFAPIPQVRRVSAAINDPPQQLGRLVREELVPNMNAPQPSASLAQDINRRAERGPSSNQQALQGMLNAFANV